MQAPQSLGGQLLIAMPGIEDVRFAHAVIYVCAHDEEHAMGLILNHPHRQLTFPMMLDQLGVPRMDDLEPEPVLMGGPVEMERGFVLHSLDYLAPDHTLRVTGEIGMTPTRDVLEAIARPAERPRQFLAALGYAGWGPGQLDAEIRQNVWLVGPADPDLIFSRRHDDKWNRSLAMIGIVPSALSGDAGHA